MTAQSEADKTTDASSNEIQNGVNVNNQPVALPPPPVDISRGKIQTPPTNERPSSNDRPTRSTRNPNPVYIDSVAWSASEEELKSLNSSINRHKLGQYG